MLRKTVTTQFPDLERLSCCGHRAVIPLFSLFGIGGYSAGYRKRNLYTNPGVKISIYSLSCLQDVLGLWWHRNYGNGQAIFDLM